MGFRRVATRDEELAAHYLGVDDTAASGSCCGFENRTYGDG